MEDITKNEMRFVLTILKNPSMEYNANSIAKVLGLSSMGALKIAKRLEKENILISKELAKARFYRINLGNDYAAQYVRFLLKREAEQALPYVKRWISDIRKIKSADAAILFGSVLRKHKEAQDIDVLLVTDQKRFSKLQKEIGDINKINVKQIHPLFQAREDVRKNIKKGDKALLSALRGIVVFGVDTFIEALEP